MSQTDVSIRPALTPEDWAAVQPVTPESVANPHATMAIANASLPDTDPRKITREDVEALRRDIDELVERGGWYCPSERLIAKLAALLPPE